MASVLALTFHELAVDPGASRAGDPAALRYVVSRQHFADFADEMAGRPCCTLRRFCRTVDRDGLIITFDDGYASDYRTAFPLLAERGLTATFFVTAGNLGREGYLSAAQARELAEAGNEIGSHGMTHRYLVTMSRTEASREIVRSKEELEQALGLPVTSYAPVGGHYRGWMIGRARDAGYEALATMIPGLTGPPGEGPVILRRNHLQAHHRTADLRRLLGRDRALLRRNRLRYSLLHGIQRVLGLRRYDRLKALALGKRRG